MRKIAISWNRLLFLILLVPIFTSCSKDDDENEYGGSIYGVWNIESIKNDAGLIEYGKGAYADVSIIFTLNESGTYSWRNDLTTQESTYPINITGTYSYSESNHLIKLTGKMSVGSFQSDDKHLYLVTKLTSTTMVLTEDTNIQGVGIETVTCKRIK